MLSVCVLLFTSVQLFEILWTVAHQAPLMGLPRQEHWGGLPFPFPGDLPDPGIEPTSPVLLYCKQILCLLIFNMKILLASKLIFETMSVQFSSVAQSCPILCDPMDCTLPGSSVRGIIQARILEWVVVPFSRGSSQPRDQTQVSCIAGEFFTS